MSIEDQAQDHEIKLWERRNAPRPERPTYAPGDPKYGPACCEECDEPMPTLRRANGWLLCTSCQSLAERGRLKR